MNKKYKTYDEWLADTFWGKRSEESEEQKNENSSFVVAPIKAEKAVISNALNPGEHWYARVAANN